MPPRDDLTISPLTDETVHGVAELAKRCFSTPWSEDIYRREVQNPMGFTLVCLHDTEVVGFINCGFVLDELTLNTLAVDETYRRRGIARNLWDAAREQIRDVCTICYLEVRESNLPARTLYESLGFAQNGYRPHYYQSPDEAAVLMSMPLA